jgi:hypothetical protein
VSKAPTARRQTQARGRARPAFSVDRIVVLRIVFAAIAVGFLYLILKVSVIAFGGTSAQKTKQIERAVDPAAAGKAAEAAAPPRAEDSAPAR